MASTVTEIDEVARDREVIAAATPGPWHVAHVDDELAMNAIMIIQSDGVGDVRDDAHNVAAVLLQTPPFAAMASGTKMRSLFQVPGPGGQQRSSESPN
jgi:hypothetical protein